MIRMAGSDFAEKAADLRRTEALAALAPFEACIGCEVAVGVYADLVQNAHNFPRPVPMAPKVIVRVDHRKLGARRGAAGSLEKTVFHAVTARPSTAAPRRTRWSRR